MARRSEPRSNVPRAPAQEPRCAALSPSLAADYRRGPPRVNPATRRAAEKRWWGRQPEMKGPLPGQRNSTKLGLWPSTKPVSTNRWASHQPATELATPTVILPWSRLPVASRGARLPRHLYLTTGASGCSSPTGHPHQACRPRGGSYLNSACSVPPC